MNKIIETLRQRVSTSSLKVVSAPYLPSNLIAAALILVYTDWMVILLGQSGAYWLDAQRAISSMPFIQVLLSAGILPYLLTGLAYLLLVWFLLSILTRSLALLVWMAVSLVHLAHILFWGIGKLTGMDGALSNQAWVHAGAGLILGILLVRMLFRSNPAPIAATGRCAKLKPLLMILWSVLLIAVVLVSAFGKHGGWVRLEPDHSPGRRANAGIAHDLARQRIVMFGGISDWLGGKFLYENSTWEWDGTDWIEMHPDTIPQSRAGHMMAYDEKRGVVVMFGGEDKSGEYMYSDTWIWDGADWKEMMVDNYPQGRRGGQLFYDHTRETIILTGGFYFSYDDKSPIMIDDMWEWNGEEWKYLGYMQTSLLITSLNIVYDPIRGQTLLFNYNQVLVWENDQWLETGIEISLPRLGVQAAIDPKDGKMLLFGGVNNNLQLADTWLLNGSTWQELHPDPAPSVRDAYMMFHDPVRNKFILYGGFSSYALADMWELVIP